MSVILDNSGCGTDFFTMILLILERLQSRWGGKKIVIAASSGSRRALYISAFYDSFNFGA